MLALSFLAMNMVVVVVESIFYGVFLVLFLVSLYLRISRYAASQSEGSGCDGHQLWWHPVAISTTAIFLACTAHYILTVLRFFNAFIGSRSALRYYADLSNPTAHASTALTYVTMWIGDAVIIHRLWVIWNRNLLVIALPCVSLLGLIACSIASLSALLHEAENTIVINWIFITITNVYCTAFIGWRIWTARRDSQEYGAQLPLTVLVVIIESAAILVVWTIFYASLHATVCEMTALATGVTPPIVGLANMLIYIRIGLGYPHHSPSIDAGVLTSHLSMLNESVSIPRAPPITISERLEV
ncbi:hypothetical protein GGX14DRAFT_485004 [Mycena pura]|uniref:Uncharacterized protein n=1 Tax=Mycena pura TaxID=153505 RepID=A0AAD6UKU3_9AGAR|nr:hypothetical protein GGX14DRAFT_485004 [Mycena pura]